MTVKSNQLEVPYIQADKTKLDGIEEGAQVNPALASQAVAEAGVDNSQYMSALRVAQAIAALASGSGEVNTVSNEGVGNNIFIQKTDVNFELRTLVAGTGIAITENADTLSLAVTITDTNDLSEGATNLYYTEGRVSANSSVAANTAKVSADGSIDTHSDVSLSSPTNGQVLKYNGSSWVNAAEAGGGASSLNDLTDVTINSPSNGQTLVYNGSVWVNVAGSSSIQAEITIPADSTLADRIAGATGLPAGWSIVLGNNGSVDAGLTTVGAGANDIVIITDAGKAPIFRVYKDFGGLVYQEEIFSPTSGETFISSDRNQLLLKDFNTKVGAPDAYISIVIP